MNNLSNRIYSYYSGRFQELPLDKQIHFASRLFFWSGDSACAQKLSELHARIIKPEITTAEFVRKLYEGRIFTIGQGSITALGHRALYAAQYPTLRHTASTLYWMSQLDALYSANLRQTINEVSPATQLQKLYDDLAADDAATAKLSTYAVNFMYLYRLYILRLSGPDPEHFLRLAANPEIYTLTDPVQRQLCIYLLTHTIINDSMFYRRRLPAKRLPTYRIIAQRLQELIGAAFNEISLDNKLEFLVCCRLVGYVPDLRERIMDEGVHSISPEGAFIIDTLNNHANSPYQSFPKSEHRNVLYIMAAEASRFDV